MLILKENTIIFTNSLPNIKIIMLSINIMKSKKITKKSFKKFLKNNEKIIIKKVYKKVKNIFKI